MSRKKIKSVNKKTKTKIKPVSPRYILQSALNDKRQQRRESENADIIALDTLEEISLDQADSYKYRQDIATKLGWSIGRITNTINRVTALLRMEENNKGKKDGN
jgi:signal transduction histidine kinase